MAMMKMMTNQLVRRVTLWAISLQMWSFFDFWPHVVSHTPHELISSRLHFDHSININQIDTRRYCTTEDYIARILSILPIFFISFSTMHFCSYISQDIAQWFAHFSFFLIDLFDLALKILAQFEYINAVGHYKVLSGEKKMLSHSHWCRHLTKTIFRLMSTREANKCCYH